MLSIREDIAFIKQKEQAIFKEILRKQQKNTAIS